MTQIEKHRSSSAANALGGRTARACDSCVRRRARWYCAADEAFLCQACDSSVHSANPLARRHHRFRLNTSSSSLSSKQGVPPPPAWHRGFTRKPRTPRGKPPMLTQRSEPLVPDNNTTEPKEEEEQEEELLYRVPIFDPDLAELYSPPAVTTLKPQVTSAAAAASDDIPVGFNFHPTDVELAEFAADVESLLGQGLDVEEQYLCMDRLGLSGDAGCCQLSDVKMEAGGGGAAGEDVEMEVSEEALDTDFDYRVPEEETQERRFTLRLDYEAVISAWSGSGCSLWSGGQRPQLNHWPNYLGIYGGGEEMMPGVYRGKAGNVAAAAGDEDREARVMRYREKRRTRLFAKKIRYEVRKLNAEKRPRMKGRFVKRSSSFSPAAGDGSFSY